MNSLHPLSQRVTHSQTFDGPLSKRCRTHKTCLTWIDRAEAAEVCESCSEANEKRTPAQWFIIQLGQATVMAHWLLIRLSIRPDATGVKRDYRTRLSIPHEQQGGSR